MAGSGPGIGGSHHGCLLLTYSSIGEEDGCIRSKLVQIDECVAVLPSLGHSSSRWRAKKDNAVNKETSLRPITRMNGYCY